MRYVLRSIYENFLNKWIEKRDHVYQIGFISRDIKTIAYSIKPLSLDDLQTKIMRLEVPLLIDCKTYACKISEFFVLRNDGGYVEKY